MDDAVDTFDDDVETLEMENEGTAIEDKGSLPREAALSYNRCFRHRT